MAERLKMEKLILVQGGKATTPAMRAPAVVSDRCASTVERKKRSKNCVEAAMGENYSVES